MQVSSDGVVKYISTQSGKTKDGNRTWYRVTVIDEKGATMDVYANNEAGVIARSLNFGDEVTCIFSLEAGRNGSFLTLIDIVKGG